MKSGAKVLYHRQEYVVAFDVDEGDCDCILLRESDGAMLSGVHLSRIEPISDAKAENL